MAVAKVAINVTTNAGIDTYKEKIIVSTDPEAFDSNGRDSSESRPLLFSREMCYETDCAGSRQVLSPLNF